LILFIVSGVVIAVIQNKPVYAGVVATVAYVASDAVIKTKAVYTVPDVTAEYIVPFQIMLL